MLTPRFHFSSGHQSIVNTNPYPNRNTIMIDTHADGNRLLAHTCSLRELSACRVSSRLVCLIMQIERLAFASRVPSGDQGTGYSKHERGTKEEQDPAKEGSHCYRAETEIPVLHRRQLCVG